MHAQRAYSLLAWGGGDEEEAKQSPLEYVAWQVLKEQDLNTQNLKESIISKMLQYLQRS
jgi:RNase P/RNase MRP subunit POP5